MCIYVKFLNRQRKSIAYGLLAAYSYNYKKSMPHFACLHPIKHNIEMRMSCISVN
jgi:hypothetical protein